MLVPPSFLILAAGLGTRLRPITENCPKALVPFGGVPLLYLAIAKAHTLFPEAKIYVNAHHHWESLFAAIKALPDFLPKPSLIVEKKAPLGTIEPYWHTDENEGLFILNADVYTWDPLKDFTKLSLASDEKWTLFASLGKNEKGKSLFCNERGQVEYISLAEKDLIPYSFACAQFLKPACFRSHKSQDFVSFFEDAKKAHALPMVLETKEKWFDLGTPKELFKAYEFFFEKKDFAPFEPFWQENPHFLRLSNGDCQGGFEGPFLKVAKLTGENFRLGPKVAVLGESSIGKGASLENALLFDGAIVEDGEVLKDVIIGKDYRIHLAHSSIE